MFRVLLSDFWSLLTVYPRSVLRGWRDTAHTWSHYYPNRLFRRADLMCLRAYFWSSPYALCHRYLRSFSSGTVQKIYGETPCRTFEQIAQTLQLTGQDVVYELGSGRGRGVFWLHAFYGCRTVGVEINPVFVKRALRIRNALKLPASQIDFIESDLARLDYADATVLYFYGTAFSNRAIVMIMATCFVHLRPGTRLVSVSYPLTDYTSDDMFVIEHQFVASYPWGDAEVYVQRRI